jgi:UDP-glucose 4-epimerase
LHHVDEVHVVKKSIVTGAGGFIGSAMLRHLADSGVPVTGIFRSLADRTPGPGLIRRIECDLREPDALAGLLDSETVVFHFAGHTSVAGSVREPLDDFANNVTATMEVMESIRNEGGILILPSSPAVFGPQTQLPIRESASKNPVSPYGAAKMACEGYATAYHKCYDLDVRIARIFNVYGPGIRKFAIYDFWNKIRRNPNQMEILGNGDQVRDYLYIDDCIEALMTVATKGSPGMDYNIATGSPIQTIHLAKLIAQLMGFPDVEISARGETFPGDIARWYADISRLRDLGFEPKVGLQQGLERTVAWLNAAHQDSNADGIPQTL